MSGFQYYSGTSITKHMQEREELQLHVSPYNIYDKFAVEIYRNGTMLGHVLERLTYQ